MSHMEEFQHLKIPLEAIQTATNNFSDENCIGQGGFGRVYKGEVVLSKGKTMVALKRLDPKLGQGNSEFWKEIMMLSFYRHENIVCLLGYCDDQGEKILMYEYAPKKSLNSYLASANLTWVHRLQICIGAARGLEYLHTPVDQTKLRILHRDIKSFNILLDNNWNAKISDFGLSKFAPANNQFSYLVSNPIGTPGYIDPLYHETGLLTKESDVYSFGVVLFEVLCGRLCYGNKNLRPLVELVQEYYVQDKIGELVCSHIKDKANKSSLELFAGIAHLCLKRHRKERPNMTQIVSILERALDIEKKANAKAVVHGPGILNVKLLAAWGPINEKPYDVTDSYLVLYIDPYGPPLKIKTTTKYNKGNMHEKINLHVKNMDDQSLSIVVNTIISVKKHRFQGEASVKLRFLTPEIPETCMFKVYDPKMRVVGHLQAELLFQPTDIKHLISSVQKAPAGTHKDGGLLIVIIHNAELSYPYTVAYRTDSCVSLLFRGELRKTPSMMNTNDPMWLQEFRFMLEQPPGDEKLHFEVINNYWWKGLIPRKESLGCVDISLADVVNKKWTSGLYTGNQGNFKLRVELHWRTSDN